MYPRGMRLMFLLLPVAGALGLAACQPNAATPAAAPPSASASSSAPSTAASSTAASAAASPAPSKPHGSSAGAAAVGDGKAQMFVFGIDVTTRVATIQRMQIVSCVGEADCDNDYKFKVLGAKTTMPVAANATFSAATDDTGMICDQKATPKKCARTLPQFAAMTREYERNADVTVQGGAITSVHEIFTP